MAYLSAVSSLDSVVQWEVNDSGQTTGGAGGGANAQAQALLNRVKYYFDTNMVNATAATAIKAGTYDAASVSAAGIGTTAKETTNIDTQRGTGLYHGVSVTGAPDANYWMFLLLDYSNADYRWVIAYNVTAHSIKIKWRNGGTWEATWSTVWDSTSDGNGGQPPSAKSNKTSNATIGWFDVVDCASGASVTLPSGGTFETAVLTYGATYNSVKTAIVAGGAMSGTASANLTMYYKRLTA